MKKLNFAIGKLKRIKAIYSKFVELWHFWNAISLPLVVISPTSFSELRRIPFKSFLRSDDTWFYSRNENTFPNNYIFFIKIYEED